MPTPSFRPTRRSGAFTLIELLVVISVVAVLAGLLLAAIGTVKTAADATRCSNVLRQVWVANLSYGNDNNGAMAATYAPGLGSWMGVLAPLINPDDNGALAELLWTGCPDWKRSPWFNSPFKNAWWKGYCRNPYLDICQRNVAESTTTHDIVGGTGYSASWPAPHVASNGRWLRFNKITHASERIWLGDGWDWYYGPLAQHMDNYRHRGLGVYLFCDGHLERRKPADGAVGLRLHK